MIVKLNVCCNQSAGCQLEREANATHANTKQLTSIQLNFIALACSLVTPHTHGIELVNCFSAHRMLVCIRSGNDTSYTAASTKCSVREITHRLKFFYVWLMPKDSTLHSYLCAKRHDCTQTTDKECLQLIHNTPDHLPNNYRRLVPGGSIMFMQEENTVHRLSSK